MDYFWIARNPSGVDAKRGDHFLQADFWPTITFGWPVIRPEWGQRTPRSSEALGSSKRLQELDDGILVGAFQFFKLLDHVVGLAAVAGDGFEKC